MTMAKYFILLGIIIGFLACGSGQKSTIPKAIPQEKAVRIANDSLEYEIIIFDPGFNRFLNSIAQPRNYHNQSFLEIKNKQFVTSYNIRASQPIIFGELYPQTIDYEFHINYGYEVNYLLFNYFLFFKQKYNQRL